MPTATYSVSVTVGDTTITGSKTRTADGSIAVEATLPVGKSGTLSTRTDNDTGVATLGTDHGITDADIVDVYWTTGRRFGMTVTTYDSTTVTMDGGSGDNLPTQATSIVVTKQVTINCAIDGDRLEFLAVQLYYSNSADTSRGHATFKDVDPAVIANVDLYANVPYIWDIDADVTNAFTGDPIVTVHATNGSSSSAATLKIAGVVDATP